MGLDAYVGTLTRYYARQWETVQSWRSQPSCKSSIGEPGAPTRAPLLLIVSAGCWLWLAPTSAKAQSLSQLSPGTHIRVTAPSAGLDRKPGRLLGVSSDSIQVAFSDGSDAQALSRAALARVEIKDGRSRARGAWRGAGIGFLTGALFGYLGYDSWCSACDEPYIGAILGAGSGVVLGAVTGAVVGVARWESVPLTVGLRTPRGGLHVALVVAW